MKMLPFRREPDAYHISVPLPHKAASPGPGRHFRPHSVFFYPGLPSGPESPEHGENTGPGGEHFHEPFQGVSAGTAGYLISGIIS